MAEYINADDARELFADVVYELCESEPDNIRANLMIDRFDAIPAADVAPVVHAKWEKDIMNSYHFCSRCAGTPFYIANEDEEELTPYCPHCGAKMDGEGSEE